MVRKIPRGTYDKDFLKGTVRKYPALERMIPSQKRELARRIENLIDFESNAKVPFQVVDYISSWVSRANFEQRSFGDDPERDKKRKYFFVDPFGNGIMAIVKEAERNRKNHYSIADGFNLIVCHSDSSCLILKPKPIKLEWDPEKLYSFTGVRLSPVGRGISVHQWLGHPIKIIGYFEEERRSPITPIPPLSSFPAKPSTSSIKMSFPVPNKLICFTAPPILSSISSAFL